MKQEWEWYCDTLDTVSVPQIKRTRAEMNALHIEEQRIEIESKKGSHHPNWILVKIMQHKDYRVISYWKRPKQ